MKSLRARLLAGLLGGLALTLAVAGYAIYRQARAEVNQLLDYQLEQTALSLRHQSLIAIAVGAEVPLEADADLLVQIWDGASGLLYVSDRTREMPIFDRQGFSDASVDGERWRVYVLRFGPRVIQVAQPSATRLRLSAEAALRNIAPFLFLLPVAGIVVWLAVGRGLAPLTRLASDIQRRTPAGLEPLAEADLPDELMPLVRSLNDLLVRLRQALDAQRQFVADAAHELRTPLTAVRLQIQLLDRAPSEAERAEALEALRQGLKRASHLTEQLLLMARLDPEAAVQKEQLDLAALARAVVEEWEPIAHARRIDLGLARAEGVVMEGEAASLRALLGNLVDNAVRYTPEGGRVDVSVYRDQGEPVLRVEDTGPGIAPEERSRVFDRFYRGAGAAGTGTGLGLAIVKRAADRHGACVTLDSGSGGRGLRVTVRFPADLRPGP